MFALSRIMYLFEANLNLLANTSTPDVAQYHLEHVYTRPKVNSNWFENSNCFEILFRLYGNLHKDFKAASFQTIARPYCTCANDIF